MAKYRISPVACILQVLTSVWIECCVRYSDGTMGIFRTSAVQVSPSGAVIVSVTVLTSLYDTSILESHLSRLLSSDDKNVTYVLESVLVTSVLTVKELVTSATSGIPIATLRVLETPIDEAAVVANQYTGRSDVMVKHTADGITCIGIEALGHPNRNLARRADNSSRCRCGVSLANRVAYAISGKQVELESTPQLYSPEKLSSTTSSVTQNCAGLSRNYGRNSDTSQIAIAISTYIFRICNNVSGAIAPVVICVLLDGCPTGN